MTIISLFTFFQKRSYLPNFQIIFCQYFQRNSVDCSDLDYVDEQQNNMSNNIRIIISVAPKSGLVEKTYNHVEMNVKI